MKRPHFALPEIYDDSLSYYDVLRKLIKSMHAIVDNLNKIPEQIANEAKARLLGDQGLQTKIDNEVQEREQGDTTLQQNINTETSAREQADQEIREGVTNKISELKGDLSNKLPKSPANWGPWTSEEQAVARERIGIPGNFELVADIELTEETRVVSINFDKYLLELYVLFSGTATNNGNSGINVCFNDGTKRLYAPACASWMNMSERYAIAHILLNQGIIYSEASSGAPRNDWAPANLTTNLNGFMFLTETQKSIKGIDMSSLNNYSWRAGCRFTVYGVRA